MPQIEVNWLAVSIAVFINFFVGFIWYTPLFGKAWATEMGMDPSEKPETSVMIRGMLFMIIGNFLMAFILYQYIVIWDPATWGKPSDVSTMAMTGYSALFIWVGFYLPNKLSGVM